MSPSRWDEFKTKKGMKNPDRIQPRSAGLGKSVELGGDEHRAEDFATDSSAARQQMAQQRATSTRLRYNTSSGERGATLRSYSKD